MELGSNPLISVCIITYNSSNTIMDTLNSLTRQTIKNFEIIISDDCSNDKTREIVRNWINENRYMFYRVVLTSTPKNIGIPGNLNNAILNSIGEYIKPLAGDDILADDAIQKYTEFLLVKKSDAVLTKIIFFWHEWLKKGGLPDKNWMYEYLTLSNDYSYDWFLLDDKNRYRVLLNTFSTPVGITGFCVKRDIVRKLEGFDTSYYQEDHPFLVKMMKAGYTIDFLDDYIVYYRRSNFSVTTAHKKGKEVLNEKQIKRTREMLDEIVVPELKANRYYKDIIKYKITFASYMFIINFCGNKNGLRYKLYRVINFLLYFPMYKQRIVKLYRIIKFRLLSYIN